MPFPPGMHSKIQSERKHMQTATLPLPASLLCPGCPVPCPSPAPSIPGVPPGAALAPSVRGGLGLSQRICSCSLLFPPFHRAAVFGFGNARFCSHFSDDGRAVGVAQL